MYLIFLPRLAANGMMTLAQAEKYVDTIRALTSELSLRLSKNSVLTPTTNHFHGIAFCETEGHSRVADTSRPWHTNTEGNASLGPRTLLPSCDQATQPLGSYDRIPAAWVRGSSSSRGRYARDGASVDCSTPNGISHAALARTQCRVKCTGIPALAPNSRKKAGRARGSLHLDSRMPGDWEKALHSDRDAGRMPAPRPAGQ